jgi:hypothetical protein
MKFLVMVLCVLSLVGCGDSDYNPSKEYCDMWKIWHDSNGEYGWPDVNNRYGDECHVDMEMQ